MAAYNLYIGANNVTGLVETDRIVNIVSRYHAGFTLVESRGYWQGKAEPSVIVTIDDDAAEIIATAKVLRDVLKHSAVGVQEVNAINFI